MAVVISPKQQHLSFPHNILHHSQPYPSLPSMEQSKNTKPSLPSISSLISDVDKHAENRSDRSPSLEHPRKLSGGSHHLPTSPDRPPLINSSGNNPPPPTPPLPGTSSFDFPLRHANAGNASPSANGTSHSNYYAGSPESTNPENYTQRSSYPPIPEASHWPPVNSPTASQHRAQDEPTSHDSHRGSTSSYPDLSDSGTSYSSLSQQRPLPGNFPPAMPTAGQQLPPIDPQMAPPYQHHHHTYPVSNPPAYSQNTDRYVCPTCQKAFSRPSSLKIHTYSHTGEKPFKCKYEGCGKYFSVRSNMKRHEKGCHGGEASSASGNSPKS